MKKLFVLLCIFLAVITICYFAKDQRVYYVSLGDFLSEGITPKNEVGASYSDFIKDHFESQGLLKFYTKAYTNQNYRTIDLINDIQNNAVKERIPIKQALDKANLITLSVGSNDIFYKMGINDMNYNINSINDAYPYIAEVLKDMDRLFQLIDKYSHCKVLVTGFYNPLSSLSNMYAKELEPLFLYANDELKKLCDQYDYTYVDIYSLLKENAQFFPNKNNIHLSKEGYLAIAQAILGKIEK